MPTNDIKTVADGAGANVLSQSAYAALTSFLDAGFSAGIVPSNQLNKTLRQSALMAYVLAQHIVNLTALDVLDNGSPATILANLSTAIRNTVTTSYAGNPNGHVAGVAGTAGSVAPSTVWDTVDRIFWVCITTGNAGAAVWQADSGTNGSTNYCGLATGTANAIVLTPAVPIAAYTPGLAVSFIVATTNTGAVTINVSGLGAISLLKEGPTGPTALIGGELVTGNLVSARVDASNRFQLTATEMGTAALANASSITGKVAAVSGAIVAGHIATFSDNQGTVQDGGPAGVTGAPFALNFANSGSTIGPGDYMVDTSAGVVTVNLATTAAGGSWHFTDQKGTWGSNTFTVNAPAGVNIICNGSTFQTLNADLSSWEFFIEYDGTNLGMG